MVHIAGGYLVLTHAEMVEVNHTQFLELNCGHYVAPVPKRPSTWGAKVLCPGCGAKTFLTGITENEEADPKDLGRNLPPILNEWRETELIKRPVKGGFLVEEVEVR